SRGKSATKLLQYMACGVPAVASAVGANRDIIKDGMNGILARGEASWSGALLALADDPALRAQLGREGRATVVADYDVRVSAPRLAMAILHAAGAWKMSGAKATPGGQIAHS
ncbi:MAG: glycosyltransferase, partial [Myxococcota bacterium]